MSALLQCELPGDGYVEGLSSDDAILIEVEAVTWFVLCAAAINLNIHYAVAPRGKTLYDLRQGPQLGIILIHKTPPGIGFVCARNLCDLCLNDPCHGGFEILYCHDQIAQGSQIRHLQPETGKIECNLPGHGGFPRQ